MGENVENHPEYNLKRLWHNALFFGRMYSAVYMKYGIVNAEKYID